jgi:hypothetical protein
LIPLRKPRGDERAVLRFLIAPLVPALVLTLPAILREKTNPVSQFIAYATVSYCATLVVAIQRICHCANVIGRGSALMWQLAG